MIIREIQFIDLFDKHDKIHKFEFKKSSKIKHNLYLEFDLRRPDKALTRFLVSKIPNIGLGRAINDRLIKASNK